jgi:glycosyltransferase involved in cell wall biosynthesis
VLEAMAAGVPVVASDIPALTEVAGSAAIRLPPTDVAGWAEALTTVIGDTGVSERMAAEGHEVAACVSWERGAAMLCGLLAAVADGTLAAAPHDALAPDGAVPGAPVAAR